MAAPSTSSDEPALPRRTLRSALLAGGLALLPLCLVGLVAAWQHAPPKRLGTAGARATATVRTSTVDTPPPGAASEAEPAPMTPDPTKAPAVMEDTEEPAASAAAPQAGRQVMRCIDHGRVTYRDLQSACPEGVGQPVTVFPTQGVVKFKAVP